MRFYWLLPSFLSVFVFSLPASAGKLLSWRFDTNQNRLVFTTNAGVQPRAQLLANPTRLIVDLPGTTLERPTVTQQYGGAIRSLRVGQFDEQTTRLVMELNPGYTLDPQKVIVQGNSPVQWSVQIPQPERIQAQELPGGVSLPPLRPLPPPPGVPSNSSSQQRPPVPIQASGVQIQNLQVTQDGFFLRTNGGNPGLKVTRSDDRRTINVDLEGATLSPSLPAQGLPINRYGVSRIQFSQLQTSPRVARVTLNVAENSPDWQASISSLGGVVILPQSIPAGRIDRPSSVSIGQEPNEPVVSTPVQPIQTPPGATQLATVQSVELGSNGTLLLIRADRPIKPTSSWDSAYGVYRITIPSAQLADKVKGPQLDGNSPVFRVRLQQQSYRNVEILVQPAAGVQIGELNQINAQLVALQLLRSRPVTPPIGSINVPPPNTNNPPVSLPRAPKGRIVVMVDPGHGGKDPGAIGRGGLREVDVILPIAKQVAALLEQQGVQAVMSRNADYFVDLAPRVQMADKVGADLFVSIHANSISNRPDVNGLETYYYGSGQRLAQTIHNSVLQSVDIGNRGVRRARFYVLRKSSMPAVLVEVGFVTSTIEAPKLANPNYQSQMATAIARGILQYIQQNF
ncbi:MAG: N-acetylmuramoyl-L-alanine amidase [Aphanothece sp. CMT-3BRIN-NPC111]|nr:N-acetylmuramoyl-L-alanine amidase [Aphanothece sp. CMT-3BRIN-NPC111]